MSGREQEPLSQPPPPHVRGEETEALGNPATSLPSSSSTSALRPMDTTNCRGSAAAAAAAGPLCKRKRTAATLSSSPASGDPVHPFLSSFSYLPQPQQQHPPRLAYPSASPGLMMVPSAASSSSSSSSSSFACPAFYRTPSPRSPPSSSSTSSFSASPLPPFASCSAAKDQPPPQPHLHSRNRLSVAPCATAAASSSSSSPSTEECFLPPTPPPPVAVPPFASSSFSSAPSSIFSCPPSSLRMSFPPSFPLASSSCAAAARKHGLDVNMEPTASATTTTTKKKKKSTSSSSSCSRRKKHRQRRQEEEEEEETPTTMTTTTTTAPEAPPRSLCRHRQQLQQQATTSPLYIPHQQTEHNSSNKTHSLLLCSTRPAAGSGRAGGSSCASRRLSSSSPSPFPLPPSLSNVEAMAGTTTITAAECSPSSPSSASASTASASSSSASFLDFPETRGKYRVLEKVGEGTFSSVYKAASLTHPDTIVALKRLYPSSSPARIKSEIQHLHVLGGKNFVLPLLGGMKEGDQVTLIFPYFPHDRFKNYLHDLTVDQIRCYARALFTALQHLHNHAVIHRDIKPGNFLYCRASSQFLLIDFGLAELDSTHVYGIQRYKAALAQVTSQLYQMSKHNLRNSSGTTPTTKESNNCFPSSSSPSRSATSSSSFVQPQPTSCFNSQVDNFLFTSTPIFPAASALTTKAASSPEDELEDMNAIPSLQ
ncbi:Cell division control protein 7, variant 3 [Balamuthia mandrillaris]